MTIDLCIMLGSMIDTDEFSNMENVATLEDQLAPLFVGNSRVREIRFQQELVNLLQKNPSILEASLSIDPQQDGSFILLLIQQVFNYSINYQHSIYKPYNPRNEKEKKLLQKVIQLHFPRLLESSHKLFSINGSTPCNESNVNQNSSNNTTNPSAEIHCPIPNLRDPGLREDFLQ